MLACYIFLRHQRNKEEYTWDDVLHQLFYSLLSWFMIIIIIFFIIPNPKKWGKPPEWL